MAITVADIELTQHCLKHEMCREGNPLMSVKRKVVYPVSLGIAAAASYAGWKMRERGNSKWWIPQVSLIVTHSVGTGIGLKFVF